MHLLWVYEFGFYLKSLVALGSTVADDVHSSVRARFVELNGERSALLKMIRLQLEQAQGRVAEQDELAAELLSAANSSAGRGSLLHDIKLSNFAGPNAGAG